MRSFGSLLPGVTARRTWDQDGRPAWEFRFSSRRGALRSPVGDDAADAPLAAGPELASASQPQLSVTVEGAAPQVSDVTRIMMVTSRGAQIGNDVLKIDEYHYHVDHLDVDISELLDGPDVALALVELAANPDSEPLRERVVSRLAVAQGWFRNAPSLDVSVARIIGRGIGDLLGSALIWQAHDAHDSFTYIVTPTLRARDLLKADPGLTRALIRVACPDPADAQGELEHRLEEAILRLRSLAARRGAEEITTIGVDDEAGVVLEVKGTGGAVSMPRPTDPEPAAREPGGGESPPAGRTGQLTDRRSDAERALSRELANLARKVGTAAVRSAPSPQPNHIDLDSPPVPPVPVRAMSGPSRGIEPRAGR